MSPGGFDEVPYLSSCQSLADVKAVVASALPSESTNTIANIAAQLWTLAGRNRMAIGDYVVLPLKTTSLVGHRTHHRQTMGTAAMSQTPTSATCEPPHWIRTDIPRTAIKQDLLYSHLAARPWSLSTQGDSRQLMKMLRSPTMLEQLDRP